MTDQPTTEPMPNYDIDPADIALADQRFAGIRNDLATCIESYRHHVGKTDPTYAAVVLTMNVLDVMTPEQTAEALAVAVQQLSNLTFPAERQPLAAEQLAQLFHATYERLAPDHGYATREASAKPWVDVPANNRSLMTAVCAEILGHLGLADGTPAALSGKQDGTPA